MNPSTHGHMGPMWAEHGHNAQIGPMWVPYINFSPYGSHIGPLFIFLDLHAFNFVLETEKHIYKSVSVFNINHFSSQECGSGYLCTIISSRYRMGPTWVPRRRKVADAFGRRRKVPMNDEFHLSFSFLL